ncbi:ABC transporter permease subunit [Caulobacter sp. S45]|uniref:ABC transporter permease subunit n=1 Tax=Caulobacter sp. S45 TaxID=1641861 RepID=UPI00131B299B|nr:ABC transporter permease subunit [Caulobacter sp. S45]
MSPRRLLPWAVPFGLLAVWQVTASIGVLPALVLPAPSAVLAAAVRLTVSGELPANLVVSTLRALAGLVIGGGLGFALGLANGTSRWSEAVSDSSLQMLRNIPHLALIPLVILWFGVGETAKIFLVALGVFFPIYLNTMHGVRSVDPKLLEMGRVYGMSRPELFRRIVLPGALPSILVGLRFALGLMWLTLIVAETIAATSGIGHMAMQAREFLQVDVVVLSILIYAALGKVADLLVRALERWLLPQIQSGEAI